MRSPAVGNIGRPLVELAPDPAAPPWAAVEVSSFQLHDSPGLRPAVGVLTNLAPDHLDRYPDVASYYAEKRLLFRNADAASVWVLNGEDEAVLRLAAGAAGRQLRWRLGHAADACYDRAHGALMLEGTVLLLRDALPLLGDHNVHNALAAALAARAAGATPSAIAAGLRTFRGLHHRLEVVRALGGRALDQRLQGDERGLVGGGPRGHGPALRAGSWAGATRASRTRRSRPWEPATGKEWLPVNVHVFDSLHSLYGDIQCCARKDAV